MSDTVLFVDPRVRDYRGLIADLKRGVAVEILDTGTDGVLQMATRLARYDNLEAVHVLSHGDVGTLHIGSTILNAKNLFAYSFEFFAIGSRLAPDGGILLYGCDVAKGASGRAFIEEFARLVGANVAASDSTTGLDGNWALTARIGNVRAPAVISERAQMNYAHHLGTINGTAGDDTIDGTSSNDTIDGGSGTDIVNLTGNSTGYQLSYLDGVWTLLDVDGNDGGADGTDTLTNIEQLYFANGTKTFGLNLASRGEFRVNTYTSSDQYAPSVSALAGGGYVVIWQSNQDASGNGNGIYGQRYNADGTPAGSEFQINSYIAGEQVTPSVAGLGGTNAGGYVVTWRSDGQDGDGHGIYAQRFGADGLAAGAEFRVNTTTANDQNGPAVTALQGSNAGGYVITWHSYNLPGDASSWGVYGQRYDASGAALGGEFLINSYTSSDQSSPSLAALSDGGFVATWVSNGQDGSSYGIYGQRYDSAGVAAGSEFRINSYVGDQQTTPSVALLSDNGFVVTWQSLNQDDSGWGIYGQRYDASGNAVGAEFRANSSTNGHQQNPNVTALTGGGFVVTWQDDSRDGWDWAVMGQRYDASGHRLGGEFRVNTYTPYTQADPSVAALADGGFVVTWNSSNGQDGSVQGVYAQRYHADGTPWLGQVTGTAGDDTLNFHGSSTPLELVGGAGNDTYVLSTANDQVTEGSGAGNDTIESSFSYILPDNVENLVLTGSGNIDATGNALNNVLTGNSGTNTVSYANASAGVNVDLSITTGQNTGGAGTDTITNFENLTGSSHNDTLAGNSGNNVIDGGAGTDVVNLTGNADGYQLSLSNGVWTLSDFNGSDGTDTLKNVEQLHFADGKSFAINAASRGEFLVNTYTSSDQYGPSVAALTGGGYVVTWHSYWQDSHLWGVYGQRYNADGTTAGSEFQINTYTTTHQSTPSVTGLSGGGFVVTWQSLSQDGSSYGIYGQRYDAAGAAVGSEFQVNTYTPNEQSGQVTTALLGANAGGFVISWQSSGNVEDASSWGVYGQRYDASGAAVGGEFVINSYTSSDQSSPSLAALSDGGFVATWGAMC